MSATWRDRPERGTRFALKLIINIAIYGGRSLARALLVPICAYFYATAPETRWASKSFLTRALGRHATTRDVFCHLYCFATTILDRVYLLTGKRSRIEVEVTDEGVLHDALAAGRGCLLLGSHLGSFELMSVVGSVEKGHRINVVMNVQASAQIQRLLSDYGGPLPYNVIASSEPGAMMKAKECLERGEIVGMLADRVHGGEETCRIGFLGADASFPLAPYRLAGITGAPVVLAYGLFLGGRRYRVSFAPLAERIERDRKAPFEGLLPWARRYVAGLEARTREAPLNWFNFYDYWAAPR